MRRNLAIVRLCSRRCHAILRMRLLCSGTSESLDCLHLDVCDEEDSGDVEDDIAGGGDVDVDVICIDGDNVGNSDGFIITGLRFPEGMKKQPNINRYSELFASCNELLEMDQRPSIRPLHFCSSAATPELSWCLTTFGNTDFIPLHSYTEPTGPSGQEVCARWIAVAVTGAEASGQCCAAVGLPIRAAYHLLCLSNTPDVRVCLTTC
uniref:Uncharacterized protein n=1 Tax=Setaria digitata TaxID=48799 RepID=A0A915PIK7_9BILA